MYRSSFLLRVALQWSCFYSVALSFSALNDSTIFNAVDAWLFNKSDATLIYGPMSTWNTSLVTNMADLFYAGYNALYKDELRSFNENLSLWDTRRVTTMSFMFSWTQAFNGNLSSWNVSQVEDMSYMFNYAYAFNGDVSSWDVSSVTDMSSMFSSASAFDGDVTSWDVSNVSDMADMFQICFIKLKFLIEMCLLGM
jgi:surface protein